MKGFTFIEVLVVLAIVIILLTLSVPLGIHFYKSQQLDTTVEGVIQALRRARLQATTQSEHSFGVFLGEGYSGQYVLFRGDSYKNRDDEEVFEISPDIFFSGLSEVVFSKLDGKPSDVGNIYLTNGYATRTININELGRIEYVLTSPPSPPPPHGCWGTEGSCDPGCIYSNYGKLTSYYLDPGCSDSCNPAGSFYVDPSGSCSSDGSGTCYKMEDPSTQYTSCTKDGSCEGECTGECTPCDQLSIWQCMNQKGCRLSWTIPPRCVGKCMPCGVFPDPDSCGPSENDPQYGCSWQETKWFWNLGNSLEGFSSYINCEWYVR